jgi:signal transduction histidine kinase
MYKQRIKEMETRISSLERVIKLMQVLNSTLELSPLLDVIVQVATQLTDTDSASVMLLDEDTGELRFVATTGQYSADVKPMVVPTEGSIAGTAFRENKPLLIRDAKNDPRWYQNVDDASGFVTESIIAVPLQLQGQVIGVVEALNKQSGAEMSWDDVEILSKLATQAAIAIHNARLLAELQRAYDDLNELDAMKSEFIAIAAHELRTPLALILGYATFLREDASGRAREQMEVVLQSAMRLQSLIDDMVNLREIDSGEAELDLGMETLQEMLDDGVAQIRYIAEAKDQKIVLAIPQEPIKVQVDRSKMMLVTINLLSNAVKFTEPGGRLGVQAGVADGNAWFTVWDTGVGIPQDQLDRIFDRFYQVETSLVRQHEGIGLGLALVKGMVDLHRGQIRVVSHPGKGSAFKVMVPLLQPS